MDFLTDENIAIGVVKFLRSRGHDVKDVKESGLIGKSDINILEVAKKENRIVITHDKDFADLAKNPNNKHKGIIIIRLFDQSPKNAIDALTKLLKAYSSDKIKGSIIILREGYAECWRQNI